MPKNTKNNTKKETKTHKRWILPEILMTGFKMAMTSLTATMLSIETRVHQMLLRGIQKIGAAFLLALGIIFMAVGFTLMMADIFQISLGLSYFITGLLIFLCSFMLYLFSRK